MANGDGRQEGRVGICAAVLGVVGHQVDLLEIVLLGFCDNGRGWAPGWFWGKCSPRILVIMGAVGHRGAFLEIVLQGFC